MNKFTVILTFCFLIVLSSFAQDIQRVKLNDYFSSLDKNNKFMGSVCASREGQNIYSKSIGFSNIELETKANNNTTYKIGSISKSFTATMIFQAVEKGKLKLSTTLDKYFPSVKNAESITIDHLLYHRSGIYNFTDNNYASWSTKKKTQKELLEIINNGGSQFTPGSKAQYSNSNYLLLSYILEKIHNKSFSEILQSSIIIPLKLKSTYFGKTKTNSYKYFDKWRIEPDSNPYLAMGAGGIISTTNELNMFFHALFSGKLISLSSVEKMKTVVDGFGRGLFPIPYFNEIFYGHTGGIDGYNSITIYSPNDKTSYSLMSNGANCVINDISIAVLNGIYNRPFDIPNYGSTEQSSSDLDKFLGVYSSAQLPIKLVISKNGNTLVAQGSGQQAFNLRCSSVNTFQFDKAGIILVFDPIKKTMTLKQNGGIFFFTK